MERVGEHPVPCRPARGSLARVRAAASSGRGRPDGASRASKRGYGDLALARESGVQLSYHWLDDRGNAIVWDGPRVAFDGRSRPASEVEVETVLRAPQPPGRYRLAFDLVEESRFWFAEVGSSPLELDVEVAPRISERRLAVVVHGGSDTRRLPRWPRRRSRSSTRTRSPSRTSSPALCPRRTGRRAYSTPTPRASSRSAARSRRATGRSGRGRPAAAATRASRIRCCFPRCSPESSRASTRACPPTSRGRRTVDLRRPDQTSTATRSSTRLKTNAPSASATTADTAR